MTVVLPQAAVADFDRALTHLPPEERAQVWMARIEAVLFASGDPVPAADLARVVGTEADLGALIAAVQAALAARPYMVVQTPEGWLMRTRPDFAQAIRIAARGETEGPDLNAQDMAVLCAIAYHQPIDRAGLKDIFGKDVSREVLSRLRFKSLIASGPRAPRPGAPHTFVTTDHFLTTFDLSSLRDLPDLEL